ncbi:hypothetical protein BJY52DRAFT_1228360 [Lactarius psammicola]|nr:hypothetical protein BJY52DRAFT_1228360 [Lactarius psammicola]
MSQVPPTAASSTIFEPIFRTALQAYEKQTKKEIASHSLATQLQTCDSPNAILSVLEAQVQTVGLVATPVGAIFVGIGVLLQAAKDVKAGLNALVDLFGRVEYFFQQLETYIEVPLTAAMKDIIVKIMVEVLLILGTVTKETKQG